MGLFSSKKSSSRSETNLIDTDTTQQQDVAEDANAFSISGGGTIINRALDEGAIERAFLYANEASEREHQLMGAFLGDQKAANQSLLKTFESSSESITNSLKDAYDTASGSIDPKMIIGAFVVLSVLIAVIGRARKRI